jgi:hypothetical protein
MNNNLWDIEQPNRENIEAANLKRYEEDLHFLKCFSTPSGKRVIEWMIKFTVDSPTWWPQGDYQKSIAQGFFREGQNSLVRQLLSKIDNAKNFKESQK